VARPGIRSYSVLVGVTRSMTDHSGATSDTHLVELWLAGRPPSTQKSYGADAKAFLTFLSGKSLKTITVADVVSWLKTVNGTNGSKTRKATSIKSLLKFAHESGYTAFNVGNAIRTPVRDIRSTCKWHERTVPPEVVRAMIASATGKRDRTLLELLYSSACRVSEAARINFCDIGEGQVTLHVKGGETLVVSVNQGVVDAMLTLRLPNDIDTAPVFKNCFGRRLSVRAMQRIVTEARNDVVGAERVSPHSFRHAHATHALENGAPLHHVQKQLGHSSLATTGIYLHTRADQGTSKYLGRGQALDVSQSRPCAYSASTDSSTLGRCFGKIEAHQSASCR
jgi:integrase/recombinase XerD